MAKSKRKIIDNTVELRCQKTCLSIPLPKMLRFLDDVHAVATLAINDENREFVSAVLEDIRKYEKTIHDIQRSIRDTVEREWREDH